MPSQFDAEDPEEIRKEIAKLSILLANTLNLVAAVHTEVKVVAASVRAVMEGQGCEADAVRAEYARTLAQETEKMERRLAHIFKESSIPPDDDTEFWDRAPK